MKVIYLIVSIGAFFRIKQARTVKINSAANTFFGFSMTGFVLLFLFLSMPFISQANLSLTGNYHGKALYIQNPLGEDGFGFCITKVTVNGKPIMANIQSDTIKIDFSALGLKIGEAVVIVLEHASGCSPIVLNPTAFLMKNGFEIQEHG